VETRTFDFRLTRGEYLRYFVRHYFFDLWTPWVISVGLAAVYTFVYRGSLDGWLPALLVFLALAVGTLLAMLALATLIFAFKLRGLKTDGIVLESKHVTVGEDGIDVAGSGSSAHYDWSQAEWVRARGRFVFVKLQGAEVLLLWPRRAVPADLLAAMQAHVQAEGAA